MNILNQFINNIFYIWNLKFSKWLYIYLNKISLKTDNTKLRKFDIQHLNANYGQSEGSNAP